MKTIFFALASLILLPFALPVLAVLLTLAIMTYETWAPILGILVSFGAGMRFVSWRMKKSRARLDAHEAELQALRIRNAIDSRAHP